MWLQLDIFCCLSIFIAAKNVCENNEVVEGVKPVTVANIKLVLKIPTLSQITSGCDPSQVSSIFQHDTEIEFNFDKNNQTEPVSNIHQVNGEGILRFRLDRSFIRKRSHVASVKSLRSNFSHGKPTGGTNFSNQQMQQ